MAINYEAREIIRRPIITESSMDGIGNKIYTFEVVRGATKPQIKAAVEEIFGVTVDSVHTISVKGKASRVRYDIGYKPDWKKAIVRLDNKSKPIEFFEGLN